MQLKKYLIEEMELHDDEAEAVIRFKNGYKSLNEKIRRVQLNNEEQICNNNLNAVHRSRRIHDKTYIFLLH